MGSVIASLPVLGLVLSLSLSGGLLILVMLLCRRILRGHIRKTWQYYIWLVVLVRLLLPIPTEMNFGGEASLKSEQGLGFGYAPSGVEFTLTPEDSLETMDQTESTTGEASTASVGAGWEAQDLLQYLWLLWLTGALVLLLRKASVYRNFAGLLRSSGEEATDPSLLDHLERAKAEAGVSWPVGLYVNPMAASPMLLGFFRPYIVLPRTDLPDSSLHYILRHELTHCKRGDMFYKWLVQLTCCLHWFNPLVWLMAREINRDCELACDEAVIKTLDEPARRAYGDTLLHAMEAGLYQRSMGAVSLSESAQRLKERLGAIMTFKNKKYVTATIVLALVLVCSAIIVGACVQTGESELKLQTIYEGDGGYYIVCEGVGEERIPELTEAENTIKLVLVEKDRTVLVELPDDFWNLEAQAEEQCKTMVRAGEMTRREKRLVIQAAKEICEVFGQNQALYSAIKIGYPPVGQYETPDGTQHEGPYIYAYFWNEKGYENTKPSIDYTIWDAQAQKDVTLTIYFNDESIMDDPEAVKVLQDHLALAYRMSKDSDVLVTEFLVDWLDYIGDVGAETLAEQYYEQYHNGDDMSGSRDDAFCEILGLLSEGTRREWLERMYMAEDTMGFMYVLDSLGGRGEDDHEMVEELAQRAYADDNGKIFNILVKFYMDREELEQWQERIEQDGRKTLLSGVLKALRTVDT